MKNNVPDLILCQTEDGKQRIEVHLQDETVWLSQKLMAGLFQTAHSTAKCNKKSFVG